MQARLCCKDLPDPAYASHYYFPDELLSEAFRERPSLKAKLSLRPSIGGVSTRVKSKDVRPTRRREPVDFPSKRGKDREKERVGWTATKDLAGHLSSDALAHAMHLRGTDFLCFGLVSWNI